MRIRKNAKVSSLQLLTDSASHASCGGGGVGQRHLLEVLLQPHVCHLNQSPWDSPGSSLYSPLPLQQREHSFTATVNSLNDSAPIQESLAEEAKPEEEEKLIVKGKKVIGAGTRRRRKKKCWKGAEKKSSSSYCQRNDGKGWCCENKAADGSSMCVYHVSDCSILDNNGNATGKKRGGAAGNSRRGRKKGATSNPYEFYYYTGFGPSWRRRGGGGCVKRENGLSGVTDNIAGPTCMKPSVVNKFGIVVNGDNGMDIEEEDNEDGESRGSGGKKRMRKPVKARSLKSLM